MTIWNAAIHPAVRQNVPRPTKEVYVTHPYQAGLYELSDIYHFDKYVPGIQKQDKIPGCVIHCVIHRIPYSRISTDDYSPRAAGKRLIRINLSRFTVYPNHMFDVITLTILID